VVYVDYVDDAAGLIDPIANSVLAAPRSPLALEWSPQRSANPVWVLRQRAKDELDACSCNGLGKMFS
jgi:hypothetical protein